MLWWLEVEGDPFDLETLRDLFPDGDPRIVERNSSFVLEATLDADASDDPKGLLGTASALLWVMNGIAVLDQALHRAVVLNGKLESEEGHCHTVVRIGTARDRLKPPTIIGSTWLDVARSSERVADVLHRLGSEELDWVSMSRILDIIKFDVGGEPQLVSHGWATADELGRFGASANNPAVSGRAARHGAQTREAPKRTISLDQAQDLTRRVARRWIEWRDPGAKT